MTAHVLKLICGILKRRSEVTPSKCLYHAAKNNLASFHDHVKAYECSIREIACDMIVLLE